MKKELFSEFSESQCEILFECLLHAIESNTGIGFRSYDQGHPDYADGSDGVHVPNGDSEEKNILFQMMKELSLRLADPYPAMIYSKYGLTTWEEFCKRAHKCYHENYEKDTYTPLHLRKD